MKAGAPTATSNYANTKETAAEPTESSSLPSQQEQQRDSVTSSAATIKTAHIFSRVARAPAATAPPSHGAPLKQSLFEKPCSDAALRPEDDDDDNVSHTWSLRSAGTFVPAAVPKRQKAWKLCRMCAYVKKMLSCCRHNDHHTHHHPHHR